MNRSREEGSMGTGSRGAMDFGDARPALTTDDALLYLRQVKQRFQHRKEVYDTFLDIMKDFKSQTIDIATVINKVKTLLRGHEDLILGFNTFLPKNSEITMDDLAREEVPPPTPQIRPAVELDQAIAYINRIKDRFSDDQCVYKNFLEILCCFRQGRIDIGDVYQDVAGLFQHHEDLLEEFSYFLPDRSDEPGGICTSDLMHVGRPGIPITATAPDPYNDLSRRRYDRRLREMEWDLSVFDEIKARINNCDAYNDLMKCVNLFAEDVISKTELIGLGSDVLGRFPDVMARFREFVASIPGDEDSLLPGRHGRDVGRGGLAHLHRRAVIQQRNKYLSRPVSELDTSDLERPTTSYIRLPPDYPSMSCSGKTALGREVLQDLVASVTTGTEDGSFKHMRKNQYEEALFRAEDERYDVELIVERTRSTIKALIPIQESMDSLSSDAKAAYRLPANTLRAFHIRTIEKIYGEKGYSVCELLKNHPVVSVPVVLCRLQQKLEEWMGVLKTMNGHWQNVADTNYHKSLDHRSFYFKQQDKKTLAIRTLLQELKDEAESARTNSRLLSFSAGVPVHSLFVPHLQFRFDDIDVHEDLFNIMCFATTKVLGPDMGKQGMEIWTQFLEPFFHLAPHLLHVNVTNVSEAEASEQKDPTNESGEEGGQPDILGTPVETSEHEANAPATTETIASGNPDSDGTHQTFLENAFPIAEIGIYQNGVMETRTEETDEDPDRIPQADGTGREREDHPGVHDPADDPSTAYSLCKPLATVLHDAKRDPSLLTPSKIFFCNEAFYLFLRYHEILYSRIKLARKCCREHFPGTAEDPDEAMTLDQESTEKRHAQFMSLVYALIDGSIDIAQFEDQCRSLLSTNSYLLFTLDKLIRCVVKQLQALVIDEPSKQVWELYKYEESRTKGCNEGVYYANTKTVVREDYVVRACSHPSGLITLTHLDNSFVYDLPNGNPKYNHSEYFNSFMDTMECRSSESAIFLNRNKQTVLLQSYDPTCQEDDSRMEEALDTGVVRYGLEMSVSGECYKIKFVEGTSDIWVSAQGGPSMDDKQKRRNIVQRWIFEQLSDVSSLPETIDQFVSNLKGHV